MDLHTLIPLKPSTSGIQYAGWEPSGSVHSGLGCRPLTGQRVPVAGGAELNVDVYLPETPGRYPAVVAFSAYSTETHTAGIPTGTNEIGSPPVFTDRGYAPVIVERRGMGRSTGEQVMFFDTQDVDDHEAVIAWAAAQPWCSGEVVLFGTSYYGMTQPLVAARRPPALRAFFANEMCTDFYRHLVAFGGVPASFFLSVWMGANFTKANYDRRMAPAARAAISHVTNGPLHPLVEKLVHHEVDEMFAKFQSTTPVEDVRRIYTHWMFDEKTRPESSIPEGSTAVLDQIDVPFAVVQNLSYFNLHQFGSYDLFDNAATPADRKWLILAPPAYDLPVYSWQGEALAFFDHVVHGLDNGYAAQPRVRYWTDGAGGAATGEIGAGEFGKAGDFPPANGTLRRLYLGSAGADHVVHQLVAEATGDGANSWAAVPRGVPVLGGIEELANQLLSFELPVTEETRLAGPVTARFTFSCNEIDSYVIARLSRIDDDGERHQLSMGAIRPIARTEDTPRSTRAEIAIDSSCREPLQPGQPVVLRFSLTPAPVLLRPGERLRLDVASRTDLLRLGPGDGWAQFDLPVPPYLSRNTLHFGGESWIDVTTVPDPGA